MVKKISLTALTLMMSLLKVFSVHVDQKLLQTWFENKDFNKLYDLHLSGREVTSMSNMTFQGLTSLEFIDLSHNKLTHLPPSIFHGLTNLERISMYYNHLKTLDEHTFYGLSKLRYIDLEHNQIDHISPNTFKGLKQLWYLDLDNNRLSHIDKQLLASADSLKYFFLKNNKVSLIEDGLVERINQMCLSFFYFDNNGCEFKTHLFGNDKCIRINSTTCDMFMTQKITKKWHEKWNSTDKEIEKLRY